MAVCWLSGRHIRPCGPVNDASIGGAGNSMVGLPGSCRAVSGILRCMRGFSALAPSYGAAAAWLLNQVEPGFQKFPGRHVKRLTIKLPHGIITISHHNDAASPYKADVGFSRPYCQVQWVWEREPLLPSAVGVFFRPTIRRGALLFKNKANGQPRAFGLQTRRGKWTIPPVPICTK